MEDICPNCGSIRNPNFWKPSDTNWKYKCTSCGKSCCKKCSESSYGAFFPWNEGRGLCRECIASNKKITVSIEVVSEKVKELINGLLNSENIPSHFTAKECTDMGLLSIKLQAVINDFNVSEKTNNDIDYAYQAILNIEKKAKNITHGGNDGI